MRLGDLQHLGRTKTALHVERHVARPAAQCRKHQKSLAVRGLGRKRLPAVRSVDDGLHPRSGGDEIGKRPEDIPRRPPHEIAVESPRRQKRAVVVEPVDRRVLQRRKDARRIRRRGPARQARHIRAQRLFVRGIPRHRRDVPFGDVKSRLREAAVVQQPPHPPDGIDQHLDVALVTRIREEVERRTGLATGREERADLVLAVAHQRGTTDRHIGELGLQLFRQRHVHLAEGLGIGVLSGQEVLVVRLLPDAPALHHRTVVARDLETDLSPLLDVIGNLGPVDRRGVFDRLAEAKVEFRAGRARIREILVGRTEIVVLGVLRIGREDREDPRDVHDVDARVLERRVVETRVGELQFLHPALHAAELGGIAHALQGRRVADAVQGTNRSLRRREVDRYLRGDRPHIAEPRIVWPAAREPAARFAEARRRHPERIERAARQAEPQPHVAARKGRDVADLDLRPVARDRRKAREHRALPIEDVDRKLAGAAVGVDEEPPSCEADGARRHLAATIRDEAGETVAAQRRHAHRSVEVHAVAAPIVLDEGACRRLVAANAGVVEPEPLVPDDAAAGNGLDVARVPRARTPARGRDRRRAVGTREVVAVARIAELDVGDLGKSPLEAHVVLGAEMDFEKAEHQRLVGDGVNVIELRHLLSRDRIGNVAPVRREPGIGTRQGRVLGAVVLAAPAPEAVLAELGRLPVGPVAAEAAGTAAAQRIHPLAAKRIVEHRRAVVRLAADAELRPVDAVRRLVETVRPRRAGRRDEEPPIGIGIVRGVVGKDAPAVERIVPEELVRALDDVKLGTRPGESVLRLGVAERIHPPRLVPHAEDLAERIPPDAATDRRRIRGLAIAALLQLVDLSLQVGFGRHDGIALVLDGLEEAAHDVRGRRDEKVVHKELSADVNRDDGRRMLEVRRLEGPFARISRLPRRPGLRQFDAVVERLAGEERRRQSQQTSGHEPFATHHPLSSV